MTGTIFSMTFPMDLIPPKITRAVADVIKDPVISGDIPVVTWRECATEFACSIFPTPKDAITPKKAKSQPSHVQSPP